MDFMKYDDSTLIRFYRLTRSRIPAFEYEVDGKKCRTYTYEQVQRACDVAESTAIKTFEKLEKDGVVKRIETKSISGKITKRYAILKEFNNTIPDRGLREYVEDMFYLTNTELAKSIRLCNCGKEELTFEEFKQTLGVKHIDAIYRYSSILQDAGVIQGLSQQGKHVKVTGNFK